MSLALKRHHRKRVMKNRKHYYNSCFDFYGSNPKRQGKMNKTPNLCSCSMCGNPHKFYKNSKAGWTHKELQEYYRMKDEFDGFISYNDERPDL